MWATTQGWKPPRPSLGCSYAIGLSRPSRCILMQEAPASIPGQRQPRERKTYFSFSLSFPAVLFSSRNSRKSLLASSNLVHCS
jgi:hypothetical protein